jgi:hypothetical protein
VHPMHQGESEEMRQTILRCIGIASLWKNLTQGIASYMAVGASSRQLVLAPCPENIRLAGPAHSG